MFSKLQLLIFLFIMNEKCHINMGCDSVHYIVKYSCISATCYSKWPL